jgi:uncharacterized membrane protein
MSEDAQSSQSESSRSVTRRTARLEALSDGVFAFAITLLVLDLAIPNTEHSAKQLQNALFDQWPGYLGYLVSFSTVGAIWLGHNAVTDYLDRADTTLLRLNLLLLLFVALLPFPTHLLSAYHGNDRAERVAVVVYGLTLLICGALLSLLWRYALKARLIRPDSRDEEITLLSHRLTPGLVGYAVLIVIGLFAPVVALFGYLAVALFFILPVPVPWRRRPQS